MNNNEEIVKIKREIFIVVFLIALSIVLSITLFSDSSKRDNSPMPIHKPSPSAVDMQISEEFRV